MDQTVKYVSAVNDGRLAFSDGSYATIPHWGEAGWAHIFCVRHAEKANDDPKDPALTAEGAARAERLGRILAGARLDSVYATPFRRNQLTAEPVVRRGQTPPAVAYAPDAQAEWLEELLPALGGKRVLVVGHQNTVPELLNQLKGGGFEYDNIPNHDYGQFYIAITKGIGQTEVMALRY